jgi:type I restriction enzyme S subunit
MKKQKYKMQEIYQGLYDGPHATPPVSDSGAIFLGISNITPDGHIDYSDIRYINESDLPKWTKRVTPKGGDIVFSYEATLNLYAIIPEGFWGCLGRRMALIRPDESKALGKYLYYYFYSDEWRATIAENTIAGSTVDRIPIAKFPEFRITLPDLSVQKKIADTLSAYDNLIDNNEKQIKLLEEAAQRLYKEWFIDLHFPGYENCKIVDGLPEGWKKSPIGKMVKVVRGRSYSSKELSDIDSVLMINLSNIRAYGGYNRNQEKHYNGKYNDEQVVETHDLLMGVTDMTQERRTVGRVALVPNLHAKAMISMDLIKLIPNESSTLFLYALLNYGGYSEVVSRFANGTNVLHLRPDVLDIVDVVVPDAKIQGIFVDFFGKIQNLIDMLQDEIIVAGEARDRLLPKLMSGEIEV